MKVRKSGSLVLSENIVIHFLKHNLSLLVLKLIR